MRLRTHDLFQMGDEWLKKLSPRDSGYGAGASDCVVGDRAPIASKGLGEAAGQACG
jgi:hypothetical protein